MDRLLNPRGERLLTLTGPVGVGKSSLARSALSQISLDDGVTVTAFDLAECEPGDEAVVQGLVTVTAARDERARDEICGRHFVLLDNCDPVVTVLGRAVTELLRSLPRLTVVCTSRVPLDVYAEQLLPIGPLSLGTDGDAVSLFIERVSPHYRHGGAAGRESATAPGICAAVDGIPLVVEMVAEAVGSFTTDELLARLLRGEYIRPSRPRDLPRRHQSVADALSWGEVALSLEDIEWVKRLSVADSFFDVELAVRIGGWEVEGAMAGLRALVHKSLLVTVDTGGGDYLYYMPYPVRCHYRAELAREPHTFAGAQSAARDRGAASCGPPAVPRAWSQAAREPVAGADSRGEPVVAARWATPRGVPEVPPEAAERGEDPPADGLPCVVTPLPVLPDASGYPFGLTPRQYEIALLVAEGMTNRQVARRLDISEWTVVNHLRQVMRKLECPSRVHVARVLRQYASGA